MTDSVVVRRDRPGATVRIDSPRRRNALTPTIVKQLHEAFQDLHGEKGVRAVILTGSSEVFCSGTDLSLLEEQIAIAEHDPAILGQWHGEVEDLLQLILMLLRFPKPVIAAVNGVAAGSGLALALACDCVLGGESSIWGLPEARRGLVAGLAGPLLAQRAGLSVSRRMMLDGAWLDAHQAAACGIADEIVADDLVWARASQRVNELSSVSPASQLLGKQLCNETIGETLLTQLSNGAANMAAARITDSARRGVGGFVHKRTVNWQES